MPIECALALYCLARLLASILDASSDRVVVVSSSTAALDIIQDLCEQRGYTTVRIDGATDVNRRQDIVNNFNLYNVGQVWDVFRSLVKSLKLQDGGTGPPLTC